MTASKNQFLSTSLIALIVTSPLNAQQSPTISLLIVKTNPFCIGGDADGAACLRDCDCPSGVCGGDITPTDDIVAYPGDRFVMEIYASQWSPSLPNPERLSAWQVTIDNDLLTNAWQKRLRWIMGPRCCMPRTADSPPGLVIPPSYECADLNIGCTSAISIGQCIPDESPPRAGGTFIDRFRSDYVFFPYPELISTDLSDPEAVRFSSHIVDVMGAVEFEKNDAPKYLASLALEVPSDGCGNFLITPDPDLLNTVLFEVSGYAIVDPLTDELVFNGVSVHVGDCPCATILSSIPGNCTLDARQPTSTEGINQTMDWLNLEFGCSRVALALMSPDSFVVTTEGVGASAPTISSVSLGGSGGNAGNFMEISFAPGSLSPGAWNCIQLDPPGLEGPGNRYCFGILPGDTNGDSVTERADLTALDDCIMNPGSCPVHSCDFDRSGFCTPADRLRLVDLLTGAGSFAIWEGKGILDKDGVPITCPTKSP